MKTKRWSQEEIEFLSQNYCKYTNEELSVKLNRTVGSIWRKADSLGLKKDKDAQSALRIKDKDKLDFLRENYDKMSIKELAQATGWTVGNVNAKLVYHRIRPVTKKTAASVTKTRRMWTKEEEDFLSNNYLTLEQKEIAKKLNRTIASIQKKMEYMGLKKYDRKSDWSEDEVNYLKENYLNTPIAVQMKTLQRTYLAIRYKANELGLKRDMSTSIEREVKAILNAYGIAHEEQVTIRGFIADFVINGNKIIEVHGDYWHCNPAIYPEPKDDIQKRKVKTDKIKHQVYSELGYDVLYIWENDLMNSYEDCVNAIVDFAVLGRDA